MIGWSGKRKTLVLLLFLGPMMLGLLVFNVYPIVYNVYISFTNRGAFHPNPDCTQPLTALIEPTCWPMFKTPTSAVGATPSRLQEPIHANYTELLGELFAPEALRSMGLILLAFSPLIIASFVNRVLNRREKRSIPAGAVWTVAVIALVPLFFAVDVPAQVQCLLSGGDFLVVVIRTVLYTAACVPLFFLVGLILALILNSPYIRFRAFWRVAMIVPWAASSMAIMIALIWQFFFREQGTINQLLRLIGVQGPSWLSDPTLAFIVVVIVNVWFSYPFFTNVILGALQSISADQYEAADVDGATWWSQLWHITVPLIRPAVMPAVVLSSITTFGMFGTVYAITNGGPIVSAGAPGATDLVMVYAYKQIFTTRAYGLMGAFAVIIFIALLGATLLSLRTSRITKGAYE